MKYKGYVIHSNGTGLKFDVNLVKGDPGTREFAEASNRAVKAGGVSILVSSEVSPQAMDKLEDLLDALESGVMP